MMMFQNLFLHLRKMNCYFKKQATYKTRKERNNSTGNNNINITGERKK